MLAAQKLAKRKLIRNVRGAITVLDRQGREAVCECYEVVNTEYNRLLGRGISRTFGWGNKCQNASGQIEKRPPFRTASFFSGKFFVYATFITFSACGPFGPSVTSNSTS